MSRPITKKRKFVADGVFFAELNEVRRRPARGGAPARQPAPRRTEARADAAVSFSRRRVPHRLARPAAGPALPLGRSQLLVRELGEEGYGGVEVRNTPLQTDIIIRATQTKEVMGENGRRLRELTAVIQKRCACRRRGWPAAPTTPS